MSSGKFRIKDVEVTSKNTIQKSQTSSFNELRNYIYTIVQTDHAPSLANRVYNAIMIGAIVVSILPLCFKQTTMAFQRIEATTCMLFAMDYVLRWMTADIKYKRFGCKAFYIYPFRFHAVIDFIAILPVMTNVFAIFKLFKLIRAVKCIRVFKVLKYSSSFNIIAKILKKQKKALLTVCLIALAYIFISAIFIYQIEPDTFDTFFDAIYWATISLTTVGYGDLYPVSIVGRLFSMVSAFFGVAFVALPAGIISAGYLQIVLETKGVE